jgi:hypothetical protein
VGAKRKWRPNGEPGEQEERHHAKDQVKEEDSEAEETAHWISMSTTGQMRSSAVLCQSDQRHRMLAAGLDRAEAVGMAWWLWVIAATGGWFGVSVAIGGLWAALHRSPR